MNMVTMENVLKRGRTIWDRWLLPEDEYVERVRAVREAMEAAGLDALVTIGHSTHSGNFTYLSGSVPPIGWMGIVLGREKGPFLVSGGGSRDLPFLRTQTWIEDIRTSRSLFAGPAEAVSDAVGEILRPGERLGIVGAREDLAPAANRELLDALEPYEVTEVDDLLAGIRAAKRPREQAALRRSLEAARAALAAGVQAWKTGASSTAALIAIEKAARMHGCRDVRVLGNVDGEQLAPVEEHGDGRGEHFVAYCAVEHLGYWAQVTGGSGHAAANDAARGAVDAMVRAAGPGVPVGELVEAAVRELPAGERDVGLSYGLGAGIGLDLSERPLLRRSGTDVLTPGVVLAVQAFTVADGLLGGASETVRVDAEGVTLL